MDQSPSSSSSSSDDTKGPETTAILVVFIVVGFLAVLLRYYTRLLIVRRFEIADALIGISLVASLGCTVCQIQLVKFATSKPTPLRSYEETVESFKYLYASIIAYNFTLCFTKVSVLLLYRRFFLVGKTRIGSNILLTFVVLYGIYTFFACVFVCISVHAFWNLKLQPVSRCIDYFKLYFTNAGLNIASDVAIVLLPLPAVYKLQIPRREKISLLAIMALGGFVCIVSCLRLKALVELYQSSTPAQGQPAVTYWSAIELNVGILCACLLTLKPLMSRISSLVGGPAFSDGSRQGNQRAEYFFPKNLAGQQAEVVRLSVLGQGSRAAQTVDDDHDDSQPLATVESINTTQSANNPIC